MAYTYYKTKIKTTFLFMKHILRLLNYCKKYYYFNTTNIFYLDVSDSIRDLHQKKFVQFLFRFLPR